MHVSSYFQAPDGHQIEVTFKKFFIGGSTCRRDYLIIDTTGDDKYRTNASQYCGGNRYTPGTVTSTNGKMNLLLMGKWGGFRGLTATYTAI